MADNNEWRGRVQFIRGFPFPAPEWFKRKNIEDALDYMPHDGDVIVASYPKTGTTWLQYIVLQIMTKAEQFPSMDECIYKVTPFMEMAGVAAVEALKKPRLYKHHIPYNMVKKNERAKYLYIYRNPEDTMVSFFHFLREIGSPDLQFDDYFAKFINGHIGYGSYFDHILTYYEHRNDANMLLISYEKLHANRREEILRIAKHVGEEYFQYLQDNEDVLKKILEQTSFDYMKQNLPMKHPSKWENNQEKGNTESENESFNFFRKGIVGDGKNVLSEDQQQRLKAKALEKLQNTTILETWGM